MKKLYEYIIKIVRAFIRFLHKAASGLELKDTILFGSTPDFSESTAEVFNHMLTTEEFQKFKLIWFCKNPKIYRQRMKIHKNVIVKKRIANPLLRLVHLYCESTSKYCIYTHELLGNIYNDRQKRIFILHGSFGIKKGKGNHKYFDYSTYKICTRKMTDPKFLPLGLPRNDRLFDEPCELKRRLNFDQFNKIIIWMPTFKHYQFRGVFFPAWNDYSIKKEYDISLQEDSGFYDSIDNTLDSLNTLLIIKYHPGQDMRYVVTKETKNIRLITDAYLSDTGIPLYSLLGATDALITDFSSVCYDYMLVNKPISYDITDLDLYIKGGSSWVKNPLDYMPGDKITDTKSFCAFIESVANGEDNFADQRKIMLDEIHVHQDGNSSQRVANLLIQSINNIS